MAVSEPRPIPEGAQRSNDASARRDTARNIAQSYPNPASQTNNDELNLEDDGYALSFTKGLHHGDNGLLNVNDHYSTLVEAINQDAATDFKQTQRGITAGRPAKTTFNGDALDKSGEAPDWRGWESPRAGHYYSLEGPDSDAVSMPPAPALGSVELDAEMAEVYALALLRDTSFADIANSDTAVTPSGIAVNEVIDAVIGLDWYSDKTAGGLSLQERRRRAARFESHGEHDINAPPNDRVLTRADIFRGSSPGVKDGPYVSQYMLQGTRMQRPDPSDSTLYDGASLTYGSQEIDQKVAFFPAAVDYMLHWNAYLDVQNGADFGAANIRSPMPRRFIDTPRDLATYVRFDQLYQAYLNACLFMLDSGQFNTQQPVKVPMGVGVGPGMPDRSPQDSRQGFATWGGPHILSLVTEIATRCLKAVRRQKYNYHRRARPERLGALLTLEAGAVPNAASDLSVDSRMALEQMRTRLDAILSLVNLHNKSRRADTSLRDDRPNRADNASFASRSHADPHLSNDSGELDPPGWVDDKNFLLAMAFAEGSPMHPSYGAGHATVAGGCVTMLKAFFNTVDNDGKPVEWPDDLPVVKVEEGSNGQQLRDVRSKFETKPLTISGELNKLAANISIGRDMAGVHFYTDYYESLRMGERVATGTLREHLSQIDEPVEMDFHSFDGDHVHLVKTGGGSEVSVFINDPNGIPVSFDDWWVRHLPATAPVTDNAEPTREGAPEPILA